MPLEHAPSTETLFRSLQHDRDREARRRARLRPMREARRSRRAGWTLRPLTAALHRLRAAARRPVVSARPRAATATGARDRRSHPGLGTHRSTTQGAPCPSCA